MKGVLELLGVLVVIALSLSLIETEKKERTTGQTILATEVIELSNNDIKIADRVAELEAHIKDLEGLRVRLNQLVEERQKEREENMRLNQLLDTSKEVQR